MAPPSILHSSRATSGWSRRGSGDSVSASSMDSAVAATETATATVHSSVPLYSASETIPTTMVSVEPNSESFGQWRSMATPEGFIIEGWSQGFLFGALMIMSVITMVNMKRGVLLHKLILIELLLAMSHGTFCFMSFHGYGWYLSATAALLYTSYFVHNLVAWLKIRSFFNGRSICGPRLSKAVTFIYLSTLILSAGPWIFQMYNNFRYFNGISPFFTKVRPFEPLFRDPWWVFSCLVFFHAIRSSYNLKTWRLMKRSPRFAVLLISMFLALAFTAVDIISSVVPAMSTTMGINPYWKLSLVFKCLTDNIMLDDFKSVLMRLGAVKLDGDGREIRTEVVSGGAAGNGDVYYESASDSARDPLQSDQSRRLRRRARRQRCATCSCHLPQAPGATEPDTAQIGDEKTIRLSTDSDLLHPSLSFRPSRSPPGDVPTVTVGVLPNVDGDSPVPAMPVSPPYFRQSTHHSSLTRCSHIRPLPSVLSGLKKAPDADAIIYGLEPPPSRRHKSSTSAPTVASTIRMPGANEIGFPPEPPEDYFHRGPGRASTWTGASALESGFGSGPGPEVGSTPVPAASSHFPSTPSLPTLPILPKVDESWDMPWIASPTSTSDTEHPTVDPDRDGSSGQNRRHARFYSDVGVGRHPARRKEIKINRPWERLEQAERR